MSITLNSSSTNFKIHPKMFALYLGMGSMIMLFTALASALIVKKGDFKHWEPVLLPNLFFYSSFIIVLSSISMQLASKAVKKEFISKFKLYSFISLVFSIFFVILQFLGWNELIANNVLLNGNPSGSYIYVISGFHGFHYILGIFILFLILTLSYTQKSYKNSQDIKLHFDMLTQYWHFIGIVWVFIYLFFKFVIYK